MYVIMHDQTNACYGTIINEHSSTNIEHCWLTPQSYRAYWDYRHLDFYINRYWTKHHAQHVIDQCQLEDCHICKAPRWI